MNLNACQGMMIFFKFRPEKIKKSVITLKALRFKVNCLSQTIFSNSAILIKKKWVESWLWGKSEFLSGNQLICKYWVHLKRLISARLRECSDRNGSDVEHELGTAAEAYGRAYDGCQHTAGMGDRK